MKSFLYPSSFESKIIQFVFPFFLLVFYGCQENTECKTDLSNLIGDSYSSLKCEEILADPSYKRPRVVYFKFKYTSSDFANFLHHSNLIPTLSTDGKKIISGLKTKWGLDEFAKESLCSKIYANLNRTPKWWKSPKQNFNYIGYVSLKSDKGAKGILRVFHNAQYIYGIIDMPVR